jgi:A118 family predicted phage portal protein
VFQRLIYFVKSLFGKTIGPKTENELIKSDRNKRRYEDTRRVNFDAIFAGSLSNKAVNDCNMTVTDSNDSESKRSLLISNTLKPAWDNIKGVLTQALGKGGKFLIPYVIGDRIYISSVDQSRCAVNMVNGDGEITSLSVVAEIKEVGNKIYQRIIDYTLDNGVITIKTRVVDAAGGEVGFDVVPEWASITPEINIGNVDRVLVGYLKSPKDSRKEDGFYGVPITYGSEDIINQIYECMDDIQREYKAKRVFVGADELLFGKDNKLPKDGLFKKFQTAGTLSGSGSGAFWEVFDPEIRDSAYYNRLNSLFALLEKSVGTSKGILTEPATLGATATEIKAANHDTFCLVSDIRKNIESCFDDLAYAVDVYAEFFGLSPSGAAGDYKVTFDWDMSLIESSQETFNQLSELESRGLISGARLNSWVTGQTMEEAQSEIDAVGDEIQSKQTVSSIISDAEDEENTENAIEQAKDISGKTLNGAQTQRLISVISQLQSGLISEGQAENIISISIGVTKEEAGKIIRGI